MSIPATYESHTAIGVPAGTYFARVRFRLGDRILERGDRGGQGCTVPLAAPQLTGAVQGQFGNLSWSTTDSLGCAPDRFRVEAGWSEGASDIAVLEQRTGQFNLAGAPFGDYVVSNEGVVTIGSACAVPEPSPVVDATLEGSALSVSRNRPAIGGVPSSFRVEMGTGRGLADLGSTAVAGDSRVTALSSD